MALQKLSQLVIFAGGKGTRLGSLGYDCPKPAVLVNGRPLVAYLIDWAQKQGFQEVILAVGHLFKVFLNRLEEEYQVVFHTQGKRTWAADLENGLRLKIRDTGAEALTGQRLYAIADLINSKGPFVATYGDTLTDLEIHECEKVAKRYNKLVCLVAGHPEARYGELIFEGDFVTSFKEKEPPKFFINRGFFVINPKIFDNWNTHNFLSFEQNVIPILAAKREVVAYRSKSWFFSVDTEVDVKNLEAILAEKEAEKT